MSGSGSGPPLMFAIPNRRNYAVAELAEALCWEIGRRGGTATLQIGESPQDSDGAVQVFLDPDGLVAARHLCPPPELLARSILISTVAPAHGFSAATLELAHQAGAVFDTHPSSIRRYGSAGIDAALLQLGYTDLWEPPTATRDIDILFIGALNTRRAVALASYADVFERFRCHLQLWDFHVPTPAIEVDPRREGDRHALLARAKVLLNIHAYDDPSFEWLRAAQAICAGCVMVSEHALDVAPLKWGEHLVSGRREALGLLAASLVDDAEERERIADTALAFIKERLPLAHAAAALQASANELNRSSRALSVSTQTELRLRRLSAEARDEPLLQPPSRLGIGEGERMILRELKTQRGALLSLRRQLARVELAATRPADPTAHTVLVAESSAWLDDEPRRVTVIVPLFNHAEWVTECLDSLAASTHNNWELVVVDDASSDGGGAVVERWIATHDDYPARLVRHEVNRGLVDARHTGVERGRGELLLMLDSDNALRRHAIERLVEALDGEPGASFAYGILELFSSDGPLWLTSYQGWNAARLRTGNYIDAMVLIRRTAFDAVGGYSNDARLSLGWEDFDLLVRLAETGHYAVRVPELIARYRVVRASMTSAANVSHTDAWAALVDHAPTLMRELEIPSV